MEEDKKKPYEIAFLLKSEDETRAIIEHLKRFEAEIISEGEIKSIKLAYPIEHLQLAYFGYIHFQLPPASINELRNALKLDNKVVRFLIITPPFTKEKSQRPDKEPTRPERKAAKPKVESSEKPEVAISNDLLEEKLEEILK